MKYTLIFTEPQTNRGEDKGLEERCIDKNKGFIHFEPCYSSTKRWIACGKNCMDAVFSHERPDGVFEAAKAIQRKSLRISVKNMKHKFLRYSA